MDGARGVLRRVVILPYDVNVSYTCGQLAAASRQQGRPGRSTTRGSRRPAWPQAAAPSHAQRRGLRRFRGAQRPGTRDWVVTARARVCRSCGKPPAPMKRRKSHHGSRAAITQLVGCGRRVRCPSRLGGGDGQRGSVVVNSALAQLFCGVAGSGRLGGSLLGLSEPSDSLRERGEPGEELEQLPGVAPVKVRAAMRAGPRCAVHAMRAAAGEAAPTALERRVRTRPRPQ